jgi:hypothetical protein
MDSRSRDFASVLLLGNASHLSPLTCETALAALSAMSPACCQKNETVNRRVDHQALKVRFRCQCYKKIAQSTAFDQR